MGKRAEGIRTESDTMGQVSVPAWAYWGAQTQRAVENFDVSDKRIPRPLIRALGTISLDSDMMYGTFYILPPSPRPVADR